MPNIVQVSAHIRRIEEVEKDLKALRDSSASKEDISRVRAEVKKLYDGLHVGKPPYISDMLVGQCLTFDVDYRIP